MIANVPTALNPKCSRSGGRLEYPPNHMPQGTFHIVCGCGNGDLRLCTLPQTGATPFPCSRVGHPACDPRIRATAERPVLPARTGKSVVQDILCLDRARFGNTDPHDRNCLLTLDAPVHPASWLALFPLKTECGTSARAGNLIAIPLSIISSVPPVDHSKPTTCIASHYWFEVWGHTEIMGSSQISHLTGYFASRLPMVRIYRKRECVIGIVCWPDRLGTDIGFLRRRS